MSRSLACRHGSTGSKRRGCSPGRYDAGDALVTVNAGAGGTDARTGPRWSCGWRCAGPNAGLRRRAARGPRPARRPVSSRRPSWSRARTRTALFASEKGVHQLVPLSPFNATTRRKRALPASRCRPSCTTSTTSRSTTTTCRIDTYRASGAGGQHVNKTNSAVRITRKPTGIVVPCQKTALPRSVEQGRGDDDAALEADRARGAQRQRGDRRKHGEAQDVNFGSRSLLRPAPVHDGQGPRTDHEMGDATRVLDGDLDGFARCIPC